MANKVLFGFSDLYVGTYTVAQDGTVTMGTPYHQPGAVGFSPEFSEDLTNFRADNINYWSAFSGGSGEGDLEVAMFDDKFKEDFLGYVVLDDGGLAKVKNAVKPSVWIAFEVQGDEAARRVLIYNCTLGSITRAYSTTEETVEPVTETLPVSINGDNATGLTLVTYEVGDTGYATIFTNPPAPTLPSE